MKRKACERITASESHLSTPDLQRNAEQLLSGLVDKVGVQHSDFTDIPQPDLRRWLPKALPDLECARKQKRPKVHQL